MNFYVDSGGEIIGVDAERIFQGSANTNTLRFIGAFPSSAQVAVSYKLPPPIGATTERQLLTFKQELSGAKNANGVTFNVWETNIGAKYVDGKYVPDYTILENTGTVNVQFFITQATENGEIVKQATARSSFFVEPGNPPEMPPQAYDEYEALLNQILAKISGDDASKVSVTGDTMTGDLLLLGDGESSIILGIKERESPAIEVSGKTEFIGNEGFGDFSTAKYGPGSIRLQTTAVDADGEIGTSKEIEVLLPTLPGHLARIEDIKLAEETVRPKPIIIELILDNDTYNLAAALYESGSDKPMSISRVDLPLEEMVVDGRFDDATNSVILTLKNGNEVKFSVAQLVNGLVSNETFQNFVVQKGQPNGFASLGADGKVPKEQLPAGSGSGGISAEEFEELLVESLTNPDEEWTAEEKAEACGTIGAVPIIQFEKGRSRIYICKPNGELQEVEIAASGTIPRGYAIPIGTSTGNIAVAPPTADIHATNKQFVDTSMTELRDKIVNDDLSEIYNILDLAGVTETIETISTYDVRDTAEIGDSNLIVIPDSPTTVTKVEGNSISSENLLDVTKLDIVTEAYINNVSLSEDGYSIGISGKETSTELFVRLGMFSEIIPTAKIGDKLYFTVAGSNGLRYKKLAFSDGSIELNSGEAVTVTKEILDGYIAAYLNVVKNTVTYINGLCASKIDAGWSEHSPGFKPAIFNGITSTSKNLWDDKVNTWTKGTNTETGTGNVEHFSNWIDVPVNVAKFATSVNGVGQNMKVIGVKIDNTEYEVSTSTGNYFINLSNSGYYNAGITAVKLATYLPKDTNLLEITTQIEMGDTVTEYVPHVSSAISFPKIEMPFGRVLDFENKKVLDYGVDIVFKNANTVIINGVERTSESMFMGVTETPVATQEKIHSLFMTGIAGFIGAYIPADGYFYVCTDSVYEGTGEKAGDIDLFSSGVWHRLLDKLGYTTAGTDATTEELAEATTKVADWFTQRYANGNPVIIRYVSSELQSSRDMTAEEIAAGNTYMPIAGGIEYQKGNSSAIYGANNTVTQEYDMYRKLGGDS